MEALAADAERYGQVNPRLRSLRGLIAWDKGRIAVRDSNHAEALRLFTVALSAGEDAQVYRSRGDAYWHLKRYGAACADFDSALRLSPQDEQLLLAKSKMLYFVGRLPESVTLLDSALKINPLIRAEVVEWRDYIARKLVSEGFQLYKQRQDQAALKVINRAILYHPAHAEAFYYRGMTYLHLSRWNDAQRDLATCITMDPHYFDAYKALDWLLAQNGEWDQITSYWSRLIAVEPGNAQAYLERGGAYFHKRDFPSAKRDAEKAGALGSEEGRRRALQLKGY
jgi:tetratricopeptide (TPR) repeat protein